MPNSKNSNYINKPFMLNRNKQQERDLYEWLETLPRGTFKRETLEYWLNRMREEKEQRVSLVPSDLVIKDVEKWLKENPVDLSTSGVATTINIRDGLKLIGNEEKERGG